MKKILLLAFVFVATFSWTYAFECFTSAEDIASYSQKNKIRQAANKLNQLIFDKGWAAEVFIREKIQQSNISNENNKYLFSLISNRPWYIRNIDVVGSKQYEKIYLDIDWVSYANITDCYEDVFGAHENKSTKTRRYWIYPDASIDWVSPMWWWISSIYMDDTESLDQRDGWRKQCTISTFLDNAYKMCNGSFNEYTDFHYGMCDSTEYLKASPGWSICWSNKILPLTYFSFDLDQYAITGIWSVYTE